MPIYISESERQEIQSRLNIWHWVVRFAFALLFLRFLLLQVIQNGLWNEIAANNQIRAERIPAMRGNIYDRHHRLLADWRQSFNVIVTPHDLTENSKQRLAQILGLTPQELASRMEKNRSWSPFIPVLVAEDISWDQFAQVEEDRIVMPGVDTEVRPVRRYYPEAALVSHVLGYLSEITREELQKPEMKDYRMGDRVGRSGLERALETRMRGQDGIKYRLVDAKGRELSLESFALDPRGRLNYLEKLQELKEMARPVQPGQSVVLTLDLNLQKIVMDDFGDREGSVVVMDVHTGELLVLFSAPGYDPLAFEGRIPPEVWQSLSQSPRHPLLNRAVQGVYPPGSVFKIVVAAGGLEEGMVRPVSTWTCPGSYEIKNTKFHCWLRSGHGPLDLEQAIIQSCDVYFYNLGERMGGMRIAEWARKFGLGKAVGEGLLEEKDGLVPDPTWKLETKKRKWMRGDTVNFAIGQGYLLTTPLQLVLIPAAVANGGRLIRPQLIHHFEDMNGQPLTTYQPQVLNDRFLSPSTVRLLQRAMEGVVQDEKGTAYRYVHSNFLRIAGKTGTSEVSKKYQGRPTEEVPYKYRDHAWFVAYAPAEAPQLAIVVLVEHGGGGGAVAGVIAKKILEDIFIFQSARLPSRESEG